MTNNLPATQTDRALATISNSIFFNIEKYEQAQRAALMICTATILPVHFRGKENVGNIVIALNFAERTGLDPIMVMQNMYIVHGKPGIEAKLAIALVNNCGKFSPLRYELSGEGKDRQCVCYATATDTGERCDQKVSMEMAHAEGWVSKSGSKWKTIPDLMLQYRSAMFFARVYCPEALLGMQTKEEVYDAYKGPDGVYEIAKDTPTAAELTQDIHNEDKDTAFPFDSYDNWKNFKTGKTGLSTFFYTHQASWEGTTIQAQDGFIAKWKAVYPDVDFPVEVVREEPKTEPNDIPEPSDEDITKAELVAEVVELKNKYETEYEQAKSELGIESTNDKSDILAIKSKITEIVERNQNNDGMP